MKTFKTLALILLTTITFQQIKAQEIDTVSFSEILSMSFDDLLNTEIISVSKFSQKLSEVPASIKVITNEQIQERGYFYLDDLLADLPGFQFRNIQGFNSYSFLRGVSNQNNLILVLINGAEINELNSGGFYGGGQYNLSNVDKVEVVYGPASVVYGTNAVSGIINIITKKAGDSPSAEISTTLGNFATSNIDFAYQNNLGDLGIRISGMMKSSEKANLEEEEGDNNWSSEMENFEKDKAIDLSLVFKDFNFGLNFQEKKASRTTNYITTGDKYRDYGSSWNIMFLNSYLDYSKSTEKGRFQSRLFYRNATVMDNTIGYIEKATDTTAGSQVGYYRPNFQLGLENQYYREFSKNFTLIGGLDLEYEQLSAGFTKSYSDNENTIPAPPVKPDIQENNLISLYLQGQYNLSQCLTFSAGIRQDFSSYYGNVFTPRMALIFAPKRFVAKLMYNEAFRAPKPWDFTSGIGNDLLDPERVKSTELSLSYSIIKNLRVETNLFYNTFNGLLSKVTTEEGWYWDNHDQVEALGTELGFFYNWSKSEAYLNYSFVSSKDQDDNEVPEIAPHSLNIGYTGTLFTHWKLNLRANYLGARSNPENNIIVSTNSTDIDNALILHTSINYLGMKNVIFQLTINNILNTEYYHTSNRPVDRYRQPQRTIRFTIRYLFEK